MPKVIFLFLIISLAPLPGCRAAGRPAQAEQGLFQLASGRESCAIDGNPKIMRERCVTLKLSLLEGMQAGEGLLLNLFDDAQFTAILEGYETTQGGGYTWNGRLAEVEGSQVRLVVDEGLLSGDVLLPGEGFQIRQVEESIYGIYQINDW